LDAIIPSVEAALNRTTATHPAMRRGASIGVRADKEYPVVTNGWRSDVVSFGGALPGATHRLQRNPDSSEETGLGPSSRHMKYRNQTSLRAAFAAEHEASPGIGFS
jgi:hypothetical protein